jgi:hypothetical protein
VNSSQTHPSAILPQSLRSPLLTRREAAYFLRLTVHEIEYREQRGLLPVALDAAGNVFRPGGLAAFSALEIYALLDADGRRAWELWQRGAFEIVGSRGRSHRADAPAPWPWEMVA